MWARLRTEDAVMAADLRSIGSLRHWPNTTSYGQQAIAMLASLDGELDESWLHERLSRERALDALEALRRLAASGRPLTEAVRR
jgi:hypothetical protein